MPSGRCVLAPGVHYEDANPSTKILEAIRKVLRGNLYVSDLVTTHLLQGTMSHANQPYASSIDRLTDRELEVFEMVGLGNKTSQIAKELCISVQTVKTHREHIKVKLGLNDGISLIRSAVQWVESGDRTSPKRQRPLATQPSRSKETSRSLSGLSMKAVPRVGIAGAPGSWSQSRDSVIVEAPHETRSSRREEARDFYSVPM